MVYIRTEKYGFHPVSERTAMELFENANPDWKKEEGTQLVMFSKTDSVACTKKETGEWIGVQF